MLRVFQNDLLDPAHFVVTLELVPGRESIGRSVEQVRRIAADAYADGRISAVSMTDNPGGNPALSPDALGHEIFRLGMDTIVHFTCRDLNRVGMESRALQLALMGMKNILALTGDFAGQGFGGQGAPVFDLDAVNLLAMLGMLNERMAAVGDPDGFFAGCAVSPFKYTEGESFAQYAKLCRKTAAGARFAITQLGYDAAKYAELLQMQQAMGLSLPVLGSVYLLSPGAARLMHAGRVPGAVVDRALLERVLGEYRDPAVGRGLAIERAAKLGVVLKGLGYRGIHLGGVHRDFEIVARILDRMHKIEGSWREFLPDFESPRGTRFFAFRYMNAQAEEPLFGQGAEMPNLWDSACFSLLRRTHAVAFNRAAAFAPFFRGVSQVLERRRGGRLLALIVEDLPKRFLLGCLRCGDCAIQHVGFLCPESQCPKRIRNGACGGSRDGRCEVRPERWCVWVRAYRRLSAAGEIRDLAAGCIPPRMWELDGTSSWLNFHLGRDHQGASTHLARFCQSCHCRMGPGTIAP